MIGSGCSCIFLHFRNISPKLGIIMRMTKIICTLGPATESDKTLKRLFENGMNVARLNFSHGTYESHLENIKKFKRIRAELNIPAALMLDTKGPEIRIANLNKDHIKLKAGDLFTLTSDNVEGNEKSVSVTYKNLAKDVSRGDSILLDDGLIELKVLKIKDPEIECEIINDGILKNNKGINVPNVSISLPYISEKDRKDILFAIENDIDLIAASFTRNADCIKELKNLLDENNGSDIKVIAKIENREGVDNIDDIIRISDGIMVARGDMGVEIQFEELPSLQKEIIKKCNIAGKPVIIATQMLESMITNPRPTRAEISDVANGVYDGASAMMLSGETAVGDFPVETLLTMSRIAVKTENDIDYIRRFKNAYVTVSKNVTNAISHATCTTAHILGASAIISVTKSGYTAKVVSKYRPACPIIAATVSEKVFNQLALSWGIFPVLADFKETTDEVFEQAIEKASETDMLKNGDLVVITGGMPVGVSGTTNALKVQIIGDVLLEGKGINKLSRSGNLCVVQENENAIEYFNAGDVIVIAKTTDDILPVLKNSAAIITEEDGESSKAVTVGLALEIPVLTNAIDATKILKSGTIVTVDASKGLVFSGVKQE